MAISRIGSPASFGDSSLASAQSVTVESGCTLFVLGVSGYIDVSAPFSGGVITLAGDAPDWIEPADLSITKFQGMFCYWISPPNGSQTLAWAWGLGGTQFEGNLFVYASYQGVDTTTPKRTSKNNQGDFGLPGPIAAEDGDLIICWSDAYDGGEWTWSSDPTGITKVEDFNEVSGSGQASGSLAEQLATGSTDILGRPAGAFDDGGIMAIAFIPGAATAFVPLVGNSGGMAGMRLAGVGGGLVG